MIATIERVMLGKQEDAPKFIARARQYNSLSNPKKLALMMLAQPDKEKGRRELEILHALWGES